MLLETLKQRWKPCVPLVPVMATANGVKFVFEVKCGEKHVEITVRRHQALLFAASQEKVRGGFRITPPCNR